MLGAVERFVMFILLNLKKEMENRNHNVEIFES